jgi:hypothetical protein
MERQSGAPRLMGFDLLDRPEEYFSQVDGADREHNRERDGQYRRHDKFLGDDFADHPGYSLCPARGQKTTFR